MSSFAIPLSGLNAAQSQLQSVSNNLANMNTVGYKDETVNFADLFSQAYALPPTVVAILLKQVPACASRPLTATSPKGA